MHSACFAVACIAVDINEDGDVNVVDIGYIKANWERFPQLLYIN